MANILIIDDEASIRDALRDVLQIEGHVVQTAASASQGLALYRANRHDVIITDVIMPTKDGVEAIKELRQEFPDARIIAISGGGGMGAKAYLPNSIQTTAYLTIAEQCGAERTITKPFERAELLKVLNEVLAPDAD